METYKVEIAKITHGRAQQPLCKTEHLIMRMNVYEPGRKVSMHCHTGLDHSLLVLDGQATVYDGEGKNVVLNKGEGVLLPNGFLYWFEATGGTPLYLMGIESVFGEPMRVAEDGHMRHGDEGVEKFFVVDGEIIPEEEWRL